jgi:dCMP deaminase
MNLRQAKAHMGAAYIYAALSYCNRRQVGCVIVKDNRIISIGYNGTPAGEDNRCEDDNDSTKSTVIHAEDNAIRKIKDTETGEGCILFVTTAPCPSCAEIIVNFGIKHVIYDDVYRLTDGIEYLKKHGVVVEQITP